MNSKIKWLLYFSIIFTAFVLNATDIDVVIPDTTTVTVGDIVDIPIFVNTSLTGENVYSYQLQINYTSARITAISAYNTGTVSESFSINYNTSVPGQISIASAGTAPLSGTGVLVYLRFSTEISGGASLNFTNTQYNFFNEGTPAMILDNGYITISAIPPPPVIYVNPNNGLLTVGDSLLFTGSGGVLPYQYSVTNGAVANISSTGMLYATGAGFTQVVAEDALGVIDTTNSFIEIRVLKLSMPSVIVEQGETFNMPVNTTDVTGAGIISGSFALSYNEDRIEAVDVITTGTILSGLSQPTFFVSDGQIDIAFAETAPISGEGVLLYVQFTASIENSGGTSISFSNVLFNEDILANTQNGYCTVSLNNPPTLNISPNTASLVAGDYLQFSVSGGTAPYEWTTSDPSIASIDNSGLLLGIRSGIINVSATDSFGATGSSGNIQLYDTRVTVATATVSVGQIYDLPIYIDALPAGQSVFSVEAAISYDVPELQAIEVVTEGTLTEGWNFAQNIESNQITFAGASGSSLNSAGGVLIKIRFQLTDDLTIGENAWVNITNLLLNEGIPLHWPQNGSITGKIPPPENVIVYIVSGNVHIEWNEVSGCTYRIYSSTDPFAPKPWYQEAFDIPCTSWNEPIPADRKFYYVNAED